MISCLPYVPSLGIEPTIEACALTGNQNPSLLVYRAMLQPTEPHWLGLSYFSESVIMDGKALDPGPDCLGLNPSSKLSQLCDM